MKQYSEHLHVKVSKDHVEQLQQIKRLSGWSMGSVIRFLIEKYSHKIFLSQK